MVGRITSDLVPAVNEHGVPYRDLVLTLQALQDQLMAAYQRALKAWLAADAASKNSKERKALFKEARTLTERVLS